tara:strand:+ start:121 stop:1488 length:1368 start_codon:yes stop_codon:yes gene_type:complete
MAHKNKKKSPLKGADPVLVKGAYDAAGGELYQKYVWMQHERMMNIVKDLMKWNPKLGAQKIIDSGGKLPQAETSNVRDALSGDMRNDYIKGNNRIKEQKLAEITRMNQQYAQYQQMRSSLAENVIAENLSEGFLRTPQGKDILDLMKDKGRLTKKKCPKDEKGCEDEGSLGIMMRDYQLIATTNRAIRSIQMEINNLESLYQEGRVFGDGSDLDALYAQLNEYQEIIESNPKKWMSITSVANLIQMKDQGTKDLIEAARNSAWQKGKDLLPEDNASFEREKAAQMFEQNILPSANISSLVFDPMFGTTSFYDNLKSHLMNHTYEQFGITDAEMEYSDLNANGIIDEDEAENIAQNFIGDDLANNKELHKELREYFVTHWENNYNLGKDGRRESYIKEDDDKPSIFNSSDFIKDDDGKITYIPQSQRGKDEDVKVDEEVDFDDEIEDDIEDDITSV